jgi:hypothetical protein
MLQEKRIRVPALKVKKESGDVFYLFEPFPAFWVLPF